MTQSAKKLTSARAEALIIEQLQAGRDGQALELFQLMLDQVGLAWRLVDQMLEVADTATRLEIAELIERRFPGHPKALRILVAVHQRNASWFRCIACAEQLERAGETLEGELSLARIEAMVRTTRYREALLLLEGEWPPELAAEAWRLRGSCWVGLGEFETCAEQLEQVLPDLPAETGGLGYAWKELGRALDRLGRVPEAFRCFEKGGDILAESIKLDIAANRYRRQIEVTRRLYTRDWVSGWKGQPPGDDAPVFMIGFPRSGTTLLEQVLDSHPAIDSLHEQPTLDPVKRALRATLFPMAVLRGSLRGHSNWLESHLAADREIANLGPEQLGRLQQLYLDARARYLPSGTTASLVVDKMPLNSIYIGSLVRLFPRAKFIVALRHPCDCVLSAFMQSFTVNQGMQNFLRLSHAASFYHVVMSLMEQFREVLDLDKQMHYIRYEDLITDFPTEVGSLLSFLGLEWDESVTRFYDNALGKGTLRTPSYEGVTRALYSSSVGRWEAYREQMAPVLDKLEPFCKRYGYSM